MLRIAWQHSKRGMDRENFCVGCAFCVGCGKLLCWMRFLCAFIISVLIRIDKTVIGVSAILQTWHGYEGYEGMAMKAWRGTFGVSAILQTWHGYE